MPGCEGVPGPVAESGSAGRPGGFFTPWDYPPVADWVIPVEVPPLPCALTPEGCGIPSDEPELAVDKRCDICRQNEDGSFSCQCTITLTHNGVPFDGPYTIKEQFSGGTIVNISADEGWM